MAKQTSKLAPGSALTPAQKRYLAALRARPAFRSFYLAGGSGLALRLGHRQSLDHDFFTPRYFRPETLVSHVPCSRGVPKPVQIAPGTLTVDAGGVKASFFHYPHALLEPAERVAGLFPVASLRDIGLMKLTAILDRGARKDFIDLYHLLAAGLRLGALLDDLPVKFPGIAYQRYAFLKALTYFDDAIEEPLVLLKPTPSWRRLQGFFRAQVAALELR